MDEPEDGVYKMDEESGKIGCGLRVCLAARKAVVDRQMGADPTLPGPGAYVNPLTEGRNSNGEVKATLSSQKSTPSISFATAGKNRAGSALSKKSDGGGGHMYTLDNITCSRQVQSRFRSAPNATFGSGPQRYHGGSDFKARAKEPSPQQYETKHLTAGLLHLSTQRSITGTKFMTGPRTYNDANAREASSKPAPGQYEPQAAIGHQVESKYRDNSAFSIHGGRRDFVKARAADEPGPGAYVDALKEGRGPSGEQRSVLSTQRSSPSVKFTTAHQRPQSAPGNRPQEKSGTFYPLPAALGAQPNSRYKTQPSFSFGAR